MKIDVMASCHKMGIISEINWFKNWFFFKMSIIKKEKGSDNFWQRKLTLKVKFWHFYKASHRSNSQISAFSFGYVDSLAKIFLILYPPLENSTTRTTWLVWMSPLHYWRWGSTIWKKTGNIYYWSCLFFLQDALYNSI